MLNQLLKINIPYYQNSEGRIRDFSLNIEFGEIHALLCKSSSEQKTFVDALENFQYESESVCYVEYKNKPLPKGRKSLSGNNISILHRKPLLVDKFTVSENLNLTQLPTYKYLPLINWKKVKKKSNEIIKRLQFNFDLSEPVENLSRENQRLVYLARVLMSSPNIIIMHEPLQELSPQKASDLYKTLELYRQNGGSILYITKQWEEAIKVSDKISVLSKGKIVSNMSSKLAKENPIKLLETLESYSINRNKQDSKLRNQELENVLETVFKSAKFITSEYELKDVMELLAKEANSIMKSSSCSIHLLDESTNTLIETFDYPLKSSSASQLTKDIIIEIVNTQELYFSNANDREFNLIFENNKFVKSVVAIPILMRAKVIGILQINYEQMHIYSQEDIKYLSALAHHAALAIEDTRLLGRSALLQESHHRIKNNLQSIASLINIQKRHYINHPSSSAEDILDNINNYVRSIASVHDLLAKDQMGRSIINVKEIILKIIELNKIDSHIKIELDLTDIFIPYNKATSISLIVNELVTNCIKHAFTDIKNPLIKVQSAKNNKSTTFTIKDNGIGCLESNNSSNTSSLGIPILKSIISTEFRGEINYKNNYGCTVEVIIPNEKIFPA